MSVDTRFKGEFKFPNQRLLKDTIKDVMDLIKDDDYSDVVFKNWKESYKINDLSIVIHLEVLGCGYNEFYTYEGIIETLAECAIEGKVEGWRDDYENDWIEIYEAGLDYDDE